MAGNWKLKSDIDTKCYIKDVWKWLISLETQARPPEMTICSEIGVPISSSRSEMIELFAGNRGVRSLSYPRRTRAYHTSYSCLWPSVAWQVTMLPARLPTRYFKGAVPIFAEKQQTIRIVQEDYFPRFSIKVARVGLVCAVPTTRCHLQID